MSETDLIKETSTDIAIIGMAGRFPGARNIEEYWGNLFGGVECITHFSDEELLARGVSMYELSDPHFVKAGGVLEDYDKFDAQFFGYSPREAEMMDPQQRIFLECAWEALENAGYNGDQKPIRIGVYGGTTINTYLLNNLMSRHNVLEIMGDQQIMIGNDKDYAVSRISYKLDLKGPSIAVQGACASSLVAVHVACQSLLSGECEIALAGGASIRVPSDIGYVYQPGGTSSPDGHCRAFDENASGSVPGSGTGVVVLKRLVDALADGDNIDAVIKGSAITNDGEFKAGFTAPSIDGQARAIAEAIEVAGVSPDTISYVEAHGTGTTVGDPIEISALTKAFRLKTDAVNYCALGSVKTNIGHLDAAAGISGLIKVVLSLKHKRLVPSLNFEKPTRAADFASSPFYVNTKLSEWNPKGMKRRAGINSIGMGGTNVFMVLEEAPIRKQVQNERPWKLFLLSAKTSTALEEMTSNLSQHLRNHPELTGEDVEYTLQVGRRLFSHRMAVVVRDIQDAVEVLKNRNSTRMLTGIQSHHDRPVAMMFPGQGAQYVRMAQGLYEHQPIFRNIVDSCFGILQEKLGLDIRPILYPNEEGLIDATRQLNQTQLTQPALFVIEYALGKLLQKWGIKPHAMIGHSIGEYVAACLAGVFSLEDALYLVTKRGELIQQQPPGMMLSVALSETQIGKFLSSEISVAAFNGPDQTVVSGPKEAIRDLEDKLSEIGIDYQRLYTSHAFHSCMMDPVLEPFMEILKNIQLSEPKIPFLSNVSGTWITKEQATDPQYWATHLRNPVRFQDGMHELLKDKNLILVECGPGHTLSSLAKLQLKWDDVNETIVLSTLRHPQSKVSDLQFLLHTLAKLWMGGVRIDWHAFHHQQPKRVPLPGYAFERKRYWIDPQPSQLTSTYPVSQSTVPSQPASVQQIVGQKTPVLESMSEKMTIPNNLMKTTKMYERPALMTEYVPLKTDLEHRLAELWSSFIGIRNIGLNDNFFELGGHSLMATQMVSRIREIFNVDLPMTKLFEKPTISGLAAVIEQHQLYEDEMINEELLKQIENMSDEEVQELLAKEVAAESEVID